MIETEIMREVRTAKEAFGRRFNFDIRAIAEYLRSLDEQSRQYAAMPAPSDAEDKVGEEPIPSGR